MNPPSIFLNYRRDDAQTEARTISIWLTSELRFQGVFMDESEIEPGASWPTHLMTALTEANIVLAVMGPGWLKCCDESGRRRIDNEHDWVRKELRVALSQRKRIIPVLVRGAQMPKRTDFPDDLQALADRQTLTLSPDNWRHDIQQLEPLVRDPTHKTKPTILLTSTSPRRKALLEQIGWRHDHDFLMEQVVVGLETERVATDTLDLTEAQRRAQATACKKISYAVEDMRVLTQKALTPSETIVVGADTVVFCEDRLIDRPLLKALKFAGPTDIADARLRAREMLSQQRGKTIHIITALAAALATEHTKPECTTIVTEAKMRNYSESDIENYIQAVEPFDMAGAFGIQGIGVALFSSITGSYENVVGLPLREFVSLLRREPFAKHFVLPTLRPSAAAARDTPAALPGLSALCVGDINYDFVYDTLPAGFFRAITVPGAKINDTIYRGAGGTAVQFAMGARRAGFKSCLIVGVVGGDALGQEIDRDLYEAGITPLLPRDQARKTSIAIILRDSGQQDTSLTLTDAHQSLPSFVVDRAREDIQKSDVFYCSGYCLLDQNRKANAQEMLRLTRRADRLAIFDVVVGMPAKISYDEFRLALRDEKTGRMCVDILVSELPEIFAWMNVEPRDDTELSCWDEHQEDLVLSLRQDFPVVILRTSTYSHEIVITTHHVTQASRLDYCTKSARDRIGYGDRRSAQQVRDFLSPRIVLASKSPQRLELLRQIVASEKIEIRVSHCPEERRDREGPHDRVERLAIEKARDVFSRGDYSDSIEFVVGADTEIIHSTGDDTWAMVGHPRTNEEAQRDLQCLKGKEHVAITGIAVIGLEASSGALRLVSDCVETRVKLAALTDGEIASYASTGECLGRAGAYAIQGLGTLLVESIEGSYSNVVGLPLERLSEIFDQDFGRPIWNFDKVSRWQFPEPIKGLRL